MKLYKNATDVGFLDRRLAHTFPGDINAFVEHREEYVSSEFQKLSVLHERSPPH